MIAKALFIVKRCAGLIRRVSRKFEEKKENIRMGRAKAPRSKLAVH